MNVTAGLLCEEHPAGLLLAMASPGPLTQTPALRCLHIGGVFVTRHFARATLIHSGL